MSDHSYDVAIVGGGPAGLSSGIQLASRGLNVVLCEAGEYPRDKVCGEFLSPECQGLLAELGALQEFLPHGGEEKPGQSSREKEADERARKKRDLDQRCQAAHISLVRMSAPNGATWEADLPGTALGVSRWLFDARLAECAEEAGALLQMGTTVLDIDGNLEEGYCLRTRTGNREQSLHARTVIAAHGKRSRLDRSLERPFFSQRSDFLALKAHFRGPPLTDRVELHGFPGGYCGLSDVEEERQNVCLLVRRQVFVQARQNSEDAIPAFLHWMRAQNPHLEAWFGQARRLSERWLSIAQVSFEPKAQTANGVLMAGDSAGLINPLAGDGIAMALESGQLAARHIERFLRGEISAQQVERSYQDAWNQRFTARMRLAQLLQGILLRPNLAGLALLLLDRLPPLGALLITRTRSIQD